MAPRLASRTAIVTGGRNCGKTELMRQRQLAAEDHIALRERMATVHKGLNVLSGTMVTAFTSLSQDKLDAWAKELRILADGLDGGAGR